MLRITNNLVANPYFVSNNWLLAYLEFAILFNSINQNSFPLLDFFLQIFDKYLVSILLKYTNIIKRDGNILFKTGWLLLSCDKFHRGVRHALLELNIDFSGSFHFYCVEIFC